MDFYKIVLVIFSLSFFIATPNISSAGTGAISLCVNDDQVATAIAGGRVVTHNSYGRNCVPQIQLTLQFPGPSETICYPSHSANIPYGYVITKSLDNPSNCRNGGAITSGHTIVNPLLQSVSRVCNTGATIPKGFAVTRTGIVTSDCGSLKAFTLTRLSGGGALDCQLPMHELADGYVITGYETTSNCRSGGSLTGLARRISFPQAGLTTTVCQGSPIPPGFVYFATGSYSGCGTTGTGYGPGYKIGPVTGSGGRICGNSVSHIPSGYVVTNISEFGGDCDGPYKQWQVTRADVASTACRIGGEYVTPPGYVVTEVSGAHSSCGGNKRYNISRPFSGLRICQVSPLPDGFAVISTGTSSKCDVAGSTATATIVETTGNGPFSICANTPIPTGFVITKEINLPVWCAYDKAWTIVRPSDSGTIVCDSFPEADVPEGFVITEKDDYNQCKRPGDVGNGSGYSIAKPNTQGSTRACHGSRIPVGFAVTSDGLYPECGTFGGSTITAVSGPGPYFTCIGSPTPTGYVITGNQRPHRHCGFDLGNTIQLPSTDTTRVCEGSPVPQGYIITAFDNNSNCGFDRGWSITLPSLTGGTFMCQTSGQTIPNGYTKATGSDSNTSRCAFGSNTGPGFTILPINQQIVPNTFINTEANVLSKPVPAVITCSNNNVDSGVIASASKNSLGCN